MVAPAENPPDVPAAEAEAEAAEEAEAVGYDVGLADDDFLWSFDDHSVSDRDAKQGDKEGVGVQKEEEEEEEEELEWLSNSDAFPPLDTSVAFGPTTACTGSVTLEGLETVMKDLESQGVGLWEMEKVRVPTKRRSKVLRRPRQALFNIPFLLAEEEGINDKQLSVRRCTHCLVDETPQWRQGPAGPGTLCNACGVRYKSGRLYDEYRPANSPTFSPGKHSNFHRKVVEMRGGKQDGVVNLNSNAVRQSRLGRSEQGT